MSVKLIHTAWGEVKEALFDTVREAADAALLIEDDGIGYAEAIMKGGICIWDSHSLDDQASLEDLAK